MLRGQGMQSVPTRIWPHGQERQPPVAALNDGLAGEQENTSPPANSEQPETELAASIDTTPAVYTAPP